MPKLDGTHIVGRLRKRLAELEAGSEVADRDLRALLNEVQEQALDAAWIQQQELRKGKKVRTAEEQNSLGWKSKRELRIDAFKAAIAEAQDKELEALEKKLRDAEVRQARIYFEALKVAKESGKDQQAAQNWANNELTRADLRRMDGVPVTRVFLPDRTSWEMEDALRAKFRASMTPEELEQLELSEEHDRAVERRAKSKR